jgi:hypothetical protein
MDRREVLKRELKANALWGISSESSCRNVGKVGCHDIEVSPPVLGEIQPGEPYYEIQLDISTGELTVTNFDGEGNQL